MNLTDKFTLHKVFPLFALVTHQCSQNINLVPVHLLSFLKFAGTCGNDTSATKIGLLVGIGCGTVLNYVETAMDTILILKDEVIFCPDAEEWSSISQFFDESCKFINCIAIVDGTLFLL